MNAGSTRLFSISFLSVRIALIMGLMEFGLVSGLGLEKRLMISPDGQKFAQVSHGAGNGSGMYTRKWGDICSGGKAQNCTG